MFTQIKNLVYKSNDTYPVNMYTQGIMMKKFFLFNLFCMLMFCQTFAAEDIVGFWKTIDEKSGQAQSIVAIYPYQGKYYGRIVGTFDQNGNIEDSIYHPFKRAPGVVGNPFYSGLDIIWNLINKNNKFTDGKILDPEKGKIYGAEMWLKNGNLVVRGKLLIFGRNQTWLPVAESEFTENFQKPNLTTFVPSIPKVNRQK